MKIVFFALLILLLSPFQVRAEEGALLFAQNCMNCHFPGEYKVSEPDEEYFLELAENIDYEIYAPNSQMNGLHFLRTVEINKIADFLIIGDHSDQWKEGGHGQWGQNHRETCLSCHDNEKYYKVPPPSCSTCH